MPRAKSTRRGARQKKREGRLNLVINPDLKQWACDYARRNYTCVTNLVVDYLKQLKEREGLEDVEQV